MPTPREIARTETLGRIKEIALAQLATGSADQLSLRGIAREIDLVPSAIYRYFDSRDALVTDLIIDAYSDLAAAIERATASRRTPRRAWLAGATALREWAIAGPHRFLLLYGTPIPGYQAPATTIAPAAAVARAFLRPLSDSTPPPDGGHGIPKALGGQLKTMAGALELALDPATTLAATGAFARAIGLITMELGGQFVGTFEPADQLYAALLARDADALGL